MATLNQIKVNTGTEDNPSYVLHDVHDKRLDDGASSLVTTCTHLLATNAALSSFNPITSANLASVLGGVYNININESIGLRKNATVYLLINDNSRECYSNLHVYSVSYPDGGGFNNRNVNFYVTSVSGYDGYTEYQTFITSFDGNNNRQIVDYTYQGVTYKAISITIDQYGKCRLCVIGNSSLAKVIVSG